MSQFLAMVFSASLLLISSQAFGDPDDIVVIVHKNNPIVELDKRSVKAIFMGKMVVFPETGEPVIALDHPKASNVREEFYLAVANKTGRRMDTYRARYLFTGRASNVPVMKE